MIILLFTIAIIILILSFYEERIEKYRLGAYIAIGAILIILATVREVGADRDSLSYEYLFIHYDDPNFTGALEFTFVWLSRILYSLFHDVHAIFFVYALLGVTLKMTAIRRLSKLYFLPLLIYVSYYYILHDLTQIRAAVASGFFLLALSYQIKGRKWIAFILIVCATFFHYSALCLFPVLLLSDKDISKRGKIIWSCIVPIGYIIYFLHINIITTLPIPFITSKVETYQKLAESGRFGTEINVFNIVFLVRILILYYNLYFLDIIKEKSPGANLIVKIEAISLACFPGLAILPVMAFRVGELYGIVDVIEMTYIFYTVKQEYIGKAVVSVIAFVQLFVNIFYNDLIS